MSKWKEYCNYRRCKNSDGTVTYIIMADGVDVEVSEEIYRMYAKFGRKMRYMEIDLKNDRVLQDTDGKAVLGRDGLPVILPEREVSLDKLIDEDWDFPSPCLTPEEAYFAYEDSGKAELRRCIGLLHHDEQALIEAIFFTGLTDQEYAESHGVTRQNVNKRKLRILKKVKSFWEQGC